MSVTAETVAATAVRYRHFALHVAGGVGTRPGERRVPGRPDASGIEPEAWTAYAPGDDLRHLDWNALGRLDTLLMRRFTAERDVEVHLLVDTSASMTADDADRKMATTAELALALAAIALQSGYAVRLTLLEDGGVGRRSARHHRRSGLIAMAALLDGAVARGTLDVGAALGDWSHRQRERGVVFVLSDLLVEPATLEPGLAALRARGLAAHLLQVLGPSEWRPSVDAGGVLEDAESGAMHTIACTPDVLRRYQALLDAHQEAVGAVARRTGATHACLVSDRPVAEFVGGELVRRGMVRPR
jgi:uncharacterized protein (DUF58 family)